MFDKLLQSLHESVKKRNTPDAYVVDNNDMKVIHRGYIKSSFPLKYDFVPTENAKSKNEGEHIYSFGNAKTGGVISAQHKTNKNIESGHETTSTISLELRDVEKHVNLLRTVYPAISHHIKSHQPDVIKFDKGIPFLNKIIKRIDPNGKKYTVKKTKTGLVLANAKPLNDKSIRVIDHIKKKINNK